MAKKSKKLNSRACKSFPLPPDTTGASFAAAPPLTSVLRYLPHLLPELPTRPIPESRSYAVNLNSAIKTRARRFFYDRGLPDLTAARKDAQAKLPHKIDSDCADRMKIGKSPYK
jgi:ribosomal protein L32